MAQRVLVVDDDQLVLVEILRIRKRLGLEMLAASSSRQGLELLRSQGPFYAVVSDRDMPAMNGFEFLQRCRDQSPDMMRLMLSSSDQDQAIKAALQEKLLFRFIQKPCTAHQLGLHLHDAIAAYQPSVSL